MPTRHAFSFVRAGGVDQVVFRSGQDIARLGELDPKLWVALACPVQGLELDARTLALIDADGDGRIRQPELVAACEWACAQFADPDVLLRGGDRLAARELRPDSDLVAEIRRVLQALGRPEDGELTLADVTARRERLAGLRFNGDGVVTVQTAHDAPAQQAISRILASHGTARTVKDRSGEPGVDRTMAEAFFADVQSLHAWHARLAADEAALPLGERTLDAAHAVEAVRAKVDDFFARCRVAAFDAHAVPALNPAPDTYAALAGGALAADSPALAALPLAAVTPAGVLPLGGPVNPAWAAALDRLRRDAAQPLLGEATQALDEPGWRQVLDRLAAARRWLGERPATPLGDAAPAELQAWLEARPAVMALIAEDEGEEAHNTRLAELEKLIRLKRDLLALLHNFVSFKCFYLREGAIFQAGTLVMDGRSCELTVRVADAKKHAIVAGLAKTCLAYCDCTRAGSSGTEKMTVAAAFTAGDTDFLFVGRNGIFYDRQGRDWDATITHLIENPTSVMQAFFAPYKKFVRALEEQVARRAAASEASAQGALGGVATSLAATGSTAGATPPASAGKPAATPRLPGRIDVGTVAALGVAMGSISAVLVAIFTKFIDLGPWIPIALGGVVAAISGPSMLIAWLKLRQRSLGPLLDASGWAINGRMKVNVRLGGSLSQTAQVPAGARRLPPRGADAGPRGGFAGAMAAAVALAALAALAWRMDWLDPHLPPAVQHGAPAPAG